MHVLSVPGAMGCGAQHRLVPGGVLDCPTVLTALMSCMRGPGRCVHMLMLHGSVVCPAGQQTRAVVQAKQAKSAMAVAVDQ